VAGGLACTLLPYTLHTLGTILPHIPSTSVCLCTHLTSLLWILFASIAPTPTCLPLPLAPPSSNTLPYHPALTLPTLPLPACYPCLSARTRPAGYKRRRSPYVLWAGRIFSVYRLLLRARTRQRYALLRAPNALQPMPSSILNLHTLWRAGRHGTDGGAGIPTTTHAQLRADGQTLGWQEEIMDARTELHEASWANLCAALPLPGGHTPAKRVIVSHELRQATHVAPYLPHLYTCPAPPSHAHHTRALLPGHGSTSGRADGLLARPGRLSCLLADCAPPALIHLRLGGRGAWAGRRAAPALRSRGGSFCRCLPPPLRHFVGVGRRRRDRCYHGYVTCVDSSHFLPHPTTLHTP